ncbi:MAG TPA: lipopolysaccharide assembly protein LapA domain-containing protein [Stellaceae bacterium]|nr:lipopolysaccharide assembly protein LapA domain-containing protein [Stellaceae bacterium]
MRLVHWVVTAPVAVVAVLFAVSNRTAVTVTLWPLPARLEAPLYLVVLLTLLVGFLAGELVAWINGGRARRAARAQGQRIEALERELAATQARLGAATPPRVDAGP